MGRPSGHTKPSHGHDRWTPWPEVHNMKVSYAMCTKRKLVLLALQPFQQFSVFIQELRLLCAKPGAGQLPGGRDQHEDMLWTVHPSEQSLSPGKFRLRRVTSIRSRPHLSTLLEEGVSSSLFLGLNQGHVWVTLKNEEAATMRGERVIPLLPSLTLWPCHLGYVIYKMKIFLLPFQSSYGDQIQLVI